MGESNPLLENKVSGAVFFPRPDMPFGDVAVGARDLFFDVDSNARLRLRLFLGEKRWPCVLFFHGNGETARDYDALSTSFTERGLSFAVAEYRGYGPCTGTPSLGTLLSDAHKTLDELRAILKNEGRSLDMVVMGRSLGSAPAIELAATRWEQLGGLIVESGFAYILPLLTLMGIPVTDLGIEERHGPSNLEKMTSISLPTLIIHASSDEIIPISDGQALLAASDDPDKGFLKVPGAGHNNIQLVAGQNYFDQIEALVERIR